MRGRPPKSDGERKSKTFRLRLTDEERQRIEVEAESCGETASAWVRRIVIAALEVAPKRKEKRTTKP